MQENTHIQDDEVCLLPTANIHRTPGRNPRKARNADDFARFVESVRAKGVMQSILVRPHPEIVGEYEVAAGYSRHEAAEIAEVEKIPAVIKLLSDEEMDELAVMENVQRQDMSPIDEGECCKRLLVMHENNEAEVQRILGWSAKKMKSRLQLSYAIPAVRDALIDGRINLGHAELLCSLREQAQPGGLRLVLDEQLSVEALKARIQARSLQFQLAAFDTSGCNGCEHSTNTQASLFETAYDKGRCLNPDCFKTKSDAALAIKKDELKESFHMVKMSSEVAKGTETILQVSGAQGVGAEQREACRNCTTYGAVISDQLGSNGRVTEGVCFNLKCHGEKVKLHQASLIATDADNPSEIVGDGANASSKSKPNSPAGKSTKPTAAKPAKKASANAVPGKIVLLNHEVHRAAAAQFVGQSSHMAKALALISMMADLTRSGSNLDLTCLGETSIKGFTFDLEHRQQWLNLFLSWDESKVDEAIVQVASAGIHQSRSNAWNEKAPEKDAFGGLAVAICRDQKLPLEGHFSLSVDYLSPHTKPVIHHMLEESGFSDAYKAKHGEQGLKALLAMKKSDLLDAVGKEAFDWSGYLPNSIKLH
ncbi:MAG: PRTRC system ParB family protein [Oleiphilus sp.]|nr:MAG: PRTRC system ParB family protein [Oleiphilus sp.]